MDTKQENYIAEWTRTLENLFNRYAENGLTARGAAEWLMHFRAFEYEVAEMCGVEDTTPMYTEHWLSHDKEFLPMYWLSERV